MGVGVRSKQALPADNLYTIICTLFRYINSLRFSPVQCVQFAYSTNMSNITTSWYDECTLQVRYCGCFMATVFVDRSNNIPNIVGTSRAGCQLFTRETHVQYQWMHTHMILSYMRILNYDAVVSRLFAATSCAPPSV